MLGNSRKKAPKVVVVLRRHIIIIIIIINKQVQSLNCMDKGYTNMKVETVYTVYCSGFSVPVLQVSAQIPVTYIDESDFSEASLIILTAEGSESIEEQIIVNRVS
jgi:hypothetical protein